jgi:transcription antitermination factor NusG
MSAHVTALLEEHQFAEPSRRSPFARVPAVASGSQRGPPAAIVSSPRRRGGLSAASPGHPGARPLKPQRESGRKERPMPWCAARTRANQEAYAAGRVARAGFEVLAPVTVKGQLFRGYLFVLVRDQWRVLESTIGIVALVKFGLAPARVPPAEIEAIRAMIDEHGYVRLPERPAIAPRRPFRKGEKVQIIGGPFEGVRAIHSGMRWGSRAGFARPSRLEGAAGHDPGASSRLGRLILGLAADQMPGRLSIGTERRRIKKTGVELLSPRDAPRQGQGQEPRPGRRRRLPEKRLFW